MPKLYKHCASYELEPAAQRQMKDVDVMLLKMLLLLMMLFLLQLLLLARYEQSPLALASLPLKADDANAQRITTAVIAA